MTHVRRHRLALALACAAVLAGCGSGAEEPASAPTDASTPERAADSCPILRSSQLDDVVGTHMTDHYARTPQGQSPLGASAVACDFDSGQGHTVKLLVAEEPVGSFDENLARAGMTPAKCPPASGIGERAVSCSGDGEAVVFAEDGGRVVMAYRGGEPGGAALLAEATEIAALILNAR